MKDKESAGEKLAADLLGVRKKCDTYQEYEIEEVTDLETMWEIRFDGGTCFGVPKEHGVEPFVGDKARLYGKGFGFSIRGLDLNGVEVYYQTEGEFHDERKKEQEENDSEQQAKADANREEMDARVAALPDCFRKRIERFRRNSPNFYWKYESYEMVTCVDAVKVADVMRESDDPIEALKSFHSLPYEEQMEKVEGLDGGHSGNTFGMVCRLAAHYINNERLVFAEHAAISALVGCDEAGCQPVTDEEMTEAGYEPFEVAS